MNVIYIINMLFSGLAQVDADLNVVPDVARSWQVLDDGRRYLFRLREDVRWTDGTLVTAHDFEWTWKRNLRPSFNSGASEELYVIRGARDYHQGKNTDPNSIGVRALDNITLEVNLERPVAYFPYLMTLLVSFPLPRAVVERYGENWWHPEHIVSNGPFRLIEFDESVGGKAVCNPGFHGNFLGNISQVEWYGLVDETEKLRTHEANRTDILISRGEINPTEFLFGKYHELAADVILLNPLIEPFTDVRVRRALSLSLDRDKLSEFLDIPHIYGGIIPPGMPGHTPDMGIRYDPDTARRLLAEAGFPGGVGFPIIKSITQSVWSEYLNRVITRWEQELGIHFDVEYGFRPKAKPYHLTLTSYVADYLDPDNFLRSWILKDLLTWFNWHEEEYEKLISTAASLTDRNQRMALYRQADRMLVAENSLIIPTNYVGGNFNVILVKPWVKNFKTNLLGRIFFEDIIIEEH